MLVPTDKIYRILRMYTRLLEGETINKNEAAEAYGVNPRSIQRDLADIREFIEKRALLTGSESKVVYDRAEGGYRLSGASSKKLDKSELFAIYKILLDVRAFGSEGLDSLLSRLTDCCAETEDKAELNLTKRAELENYTEPVGKGNFIDYVWDIENAVRNHRCISVAYCRAAGAETVKYKLMPVAVLFSEAYFYLIAYLDGAVGEFEAEAYPLSFRIDKIRSLTLLDEVFAAPYAEEFDEAEFRKRIQFPTGGKLKKLKLRCNASSLDTVLNRFPTANIVSFENDVYTLTVESYGSGAEHWLKGKENAITIIE